MEAALHSILLRRCRALVAEPGPGDPSKKAVFLVEAFALARPNLPAGTRLRIIGVDGVLLKGAAEPADTGGN